MNVLLIYFGCCARLVLAQNITTIEWNVLNRLFTATGKTRRDCFPLKDLFVFFGDRIFDLNPVSLRIQVATHHCVYRL
jgi:hypothetical protein